MSKHWRPDKTIGRIRPVGDWTRLHRYWRPARRQPFSDGAKAGLVLVGAACVGVAIGMYQAFVPLEVFAPGAVATAVETVIPDVGPDAADAEWEGRADGSTVIASPGEAIQTGLPRASGARNDRVRAHFTHCHSGGDTDCVVDGDTFYLAGAKVRIAGIDAPETHPPRCAREARLGRQATETLHALLNSGAVTMTGIGRDRDTYGRLLRNVAVDGRDVGQAMIAAGVAREYKLGRRSWC